MTAADFDVDLLRRFDGRGPRYTSYPTADRMAEGFSNYETQRNLSARAHTEQGQTP